MKRIKLTQGKYAIVDDEDFEYLNQWKWHFNNRGYAMRSEHIEGTHKHNNILMHRLVNKTLGDWQTDHINHNKLDNRKSNLRTVSLQQNHFNMETRKNSRSGYRGVSWFKNSNKWRVRIMLNGREIRLGYYFDLKDAIDARLKAEGVYHAI